MGSTWVLNVGQTQICQRDMKRAELAGVGLTGPESDGIEHKLFLVAFTYKALILDPRGVADYME